MNKYTEEQKQEIIDYYKTHTLKETKLKYNINYVTLRCWFDPLFKQKQLIYLKNDYIKHKNQNRFTYDNSKWSNNKANINNIITKTKKTLCVINCAAHKKDFPCFASQMYDDSLLFRAARDYAQKNYDEYIILSAKHGVLQPNQIIEPYEDTVMFVSNNLLHSGKSYKHLFADEKRVWAKKVYEAINWEQYSKVTFLIGGYYWEFLKEHFKDTKNIEKLDMPSGNTTAIKFIKSLQS